ncbi:MAG: enoyl-CoA hydratase/isomerase family protein [Spongiibacteraceae bacterium]|nr:enoyl-CoA hydratase/isomerase family protein [Spongiibacteraceae bacterium]
MMTFKTLLFEQHNNIGVLTLNRPDAMNALNAQVIQELSDFCDQVSKVSIGCLIITGAGSKAFVAGADIKAMSERPESQGVDVAQEGQNAFRKLQELPLPVIAAVNGFALGGGFELALSCDYIIASNNAKFGLPEVSLGLIPGFGGTQRLTRCVGKGIASRIILSGEMVDASQALQWGITTQVCEPEVLLEVSLTQAQLIVSRSSSAQALAKRAIHQGFDLAQKDGELLEAQLFQEAFSSAHKREGIAAFIEKRKPTFD